MDIVHNTCLFFFCCANGRCQIQSNGVDRKDHSVFSFFPGFPLRLISLAHIAYYRQTLVWSHYYKMGLDAGSEFH